MELTDSGIEIHTVNGEKVICKVKEVTREKVNIINRYNEVQVKVASATDTIEHIVIKDGEDIYALSISDDKDREHILKMIGNNPAIKYCFRNEYNMFIGYDTDLSWVKDISPATISKGLVTYDKYHNRVECNVDGFAKNILYCDGKLHNYKARIPFSKVKD